jgi:hypothetical protein
MSIFREKSNENGRIIIGGSCAGKEAELRWEEKRKTSIYDLIVLFLLREMHLGGISYHFVHFVSIGLATSNYFKFLCTETPIFDHYFIKFYPSQQLPKNYFFSPTTPMDVQSL